MNFSWRSRSTTNDGLLDQLKGYGIVKDKRVEAAMRAVDRAEYCVRGSGDPYTDQPLPIGYGQTISAPHMHAHCLENLEDHLRPGGHVLDVGSGSGYLAAAMMTMVKGKGGAVKGVELVPELVEFSLENVRRANPDLLSEGLSLEKGDGWLDFKENVFDAIHVGAAASQVPPALVKALKPGGVMMIPVGVHEQYLCMVTKKEDGEADVERMLGVRYVPLVRSRSVEQKQM